MALVGRDQELRAVCDLVAGIDDAGASAVILGEPGIGKSSILVEAATFARERRLTVLTATGIQAETQLPCSGLYQLLRPLRARIDGLPPPQGNALRAAFGMAGEPVTDLFLTALATLELLSDAAEAAPLVVVVDDAQWLDPATSDVLAFVSRRVEAEPIVLLAAIRDGFDSPLVDAGLGEIRLGRLAPDAAEQVVNEHAPSLSAEDRALVLREAVGNPLALVELANAVAAGTGGNVALAGPTLTKRLERTFSARVSDLPARTQKFLLVAALDDDHRLGEALRATALLEGKSAAEPDAEAFGPAIDARVIGVKDGVIRFRHPLVRSAIAQSASLSLRSAAHAALAELLIDQPDRRVWHRAAASLGPDEEIAADLEAAADRAARQGGVAEAIAAYERAARLSLGPDERGRRLLHAAELAFQLGRFDWMRRILGEVGPLDDGPLERRRQSWLLALALRGPVTAMESASIGAAIDAVEQSGKDDDVDFALDLLTLIASRCWWVVPDASVMRRLVEVTERLGLPPNHPTLLHTQALVPVERGSMVLAELERHARDGLEDPAAARLLGTVAVWMGALDLAADFFAVAVDGLRSQGRLGLLARALVAQAWVAIHLGTWSVAVPAADEGLRLATETGQPFFPTWAQETQALIAAARGEATHADSLLASVERDAVQFASPAMMQIVVHARGSGALSAGRHDEAFAQLRRLNDPADASFHPVGQGWAVADLAEAAIGSGHIDEVRPIVAELERQAKGMPSPWLHIGLRHARAVLADEAEAEGLFQDALDADLTRWPLARARLQLAYGSWLRRQRRVAESRAPLRAARDGFDALGLTSWAERARTELRASGEASRVRPPDALDHLTPQELQIAQLAAKGLSNREIGQQLYLSHRTVGFHLYRIFPKLDVTSRAQLAGLMATGALAPLDAKAIREPTSRSTEDGHDAGRPSFLQSVPRSPWRQEGRHHMKTRIAPREVRVHVLTPAGPPALLLVLLAALVAVTIMLTSASAHRVDAATTRPTIVLVHGAWAGPSGWSDVVSRLQKDGYGTSTPALGLSSSYADVATVRATLNAIPGNKILVGHSYGGSVISQAAAGRGDVLGLVYTAAFVPDEGQSLIALGAGYLPPAALQPGHLVFQGVPFASPSLIAADFFQPDFAADLNPKLAVNLSDQQVPTSFGLFFEPAGPVAWHTLPSWYAVSGLDQMIDPALQRDLAARIGATTITFDDASHAGGYTHYATRLTKLIEAAMAGT